MCNSILFHEVIVLSDKTDNAAYWPYDAMLVKYGVLLLSIPLLSLLLI